MTEDRKMLEPMATVVSTALRVLLGLLTVGVVFNLVRGSWGSGNVCITDESAGSSTVPGGFTAAPGAVVGSVPQYCTETPDAVARFLDELGALPSMLLLISSLFLLHRLLQGAAREGVYTVPTASRLRLLGWWLLLGSLLARVIEANANAALLAQLAKGDDFTAGAWLGFWSFPYLAVLTGLGLLTFARITRAGTAMREDLEGVV
ncbi:hypothetical protein [Streptomyces sp. RG80]|uniref:hypothetical protein n=1 Tax=Streptomyces sp. RG80 TaxID=3157340 RepID=UPI00338F1EBD